LEILQFIPDDFDLSFKRNVEAPTEAPPPMKSPRPPKKKLGFKQEIGNLIKEPNVKECFNYYNEKIIRQRVAIMKGDKFGLIKNKF
jgi:hypothetical protein